MQKTNTIASATIVTSIASLLAAGNAQAVILYYDTSLSAGDGYGSILWSIDGINPQENLIEKTGQYNDVVVSRGVVFHWYSNSMKLAVNPAHKLITLDLATLVGSGLNLVNKNVTVLSNGAIKGASVAGFTSGNAEYIGFSFYHNNKTCYGWASITITAASSNNFGILTINNWAYEDTGAAITVGDTGTSVPEPAETAIGLGALALGAAGLRSWRKNKAAKAA